MPVDHEPALPDYARKIANEMFPQTVKDSYSQYEVEKLLKAVCPVAESLGKAAGREEERRKVLNIVESHENEWDLVDKMIEYSKSVPPQAEQDIT